VDPRNGATELEYYNIDTDADPDNEYYPTRPSAEAPPAKVPSWLDGLLRSYKDRGGRTTEYEYYRLGEVQSHVDGGMPEGSSVLARVIDRGASEPYITEYGIDD
jgi:YD repeat-containing protein